VTTRTTARSTAATSRGARVRSPQRLAPRLSPLRGGMIVVLGPPLCGKSLVAAGLADALPRSLKLEAIDNLDRKSDYWPRDGLVGRSRTGPELRLLAAARSSWSLRWPSAPPTIIVSARFGTPPLRAAAVRAATRAGMRVLLVEALSSELRALRRIPMSLLPRAELERRLENQRLAARDYQPVDAAEARERPCLRLRRVLADPEAAVERAVAAWLQP